MKFHIVSIIILLPLLLIAKDVDNVTLLFDLSGSHKTNNTKQLMLEILHQYQEYFDSTNAPNGSLSLYAFAEKGSKVSADEIEKFLNNEIDLKNKLESLDYTRLEEGLNAIDTETCSEADSTRCAKEKTLIIVTDGRLTLQDIVDKTTLKLGREVNDTHKKEAKKPKVYDSLSTLGKKSLERKFKLNYQSSVRKALINTSKNKNYTISVFLLSPTKGKIQRSTYLEKNRKVLSNLYYLHGDSAAEIKATVSQAISDLNDFDFLEYGVTANSTRWKLMEPYQPNYFVGQIPMNVGDSKTDDKFHIRFNLSYKFPLGERLLNRASRRTKKYLLTDILKTYVTYTGTYDFYMTEKEFSAPVVSRRQNPGFLVNVNHPIIKGNDNFSFCGFDLFLQHESNGQTEEEPNLTAVADTLAYLSRGWDFYGVETGIKFHRPDNMNASDTLTFKLSGHHYSSEGIFDDDGIEDNTEWDLNNPNAKIQEYQGIKIVTRYNFTSPDKWFSKFKAAFIYKTGYQKAFQNSTMIFEVTGTQRVVDIPFFIRYFVGYGDNICSYHQKKRSIAIGLEFK